jgi:hypothetical protein
MFPRAAEMIANSTTVRFPSHLNDSLVRAISSMGNRFIRFVDPTFEIFHSSNVGMGR